MQKRIIGGVIAAVLASSAPGVWAKCHDVQHADLTAAIAAAAAVPAPTPTNPGGPTTGGYGLPMWVTFVDETGMVCQVATNGATGQNAGNSEWLGSRVISAQKAFTANAFSIDGYAISTANLYAAVQPGGSLFGLQHSNPVDASQAYLGSPRSYGSAYDPLIGKRIGGINVFGGGLAIYKGGKKVGAIGVSGDTSCRDHAFAWQVRGALNAHPASPTVGITTANYLASGAAAAPLAGAAKGDEMILNSTSGDYWNAWAQPACPNSTPAATVDNGTLQAP